MHFFLEEERDFSSPLSPTKKAPLGAYVGESRGESSCSVSFATYSLNNYASDTRFLNSTNSGSPCLLIKKHSLQTKKAPLGAYVGASEGNRTPVISLGSFYSTIELHSHILLLKSLQKTFNLKIILTQAFFAYCALFIVHIRRSEQFHSGTKCILSSP